MPPIKVLNVAEKPSVAKEVSRLLSQGAARSRRGCAQYNTIWEFGYTINGQPCDMVFTSVAGHLMELVFPDNYKNWRGVPPVSLYDASIQKVVPANKKDMERNLQQLARTCQWLVLWLDCDREGENIAYEVIEVCTRAKPGLVIKRARFSALIPRELQRALTQLVAPNQLDALAVDARQELDLRIGASFTRMQTLLLQDRFNWVAGGYDEKPKLSYGPCQFPTLGLIVQRAWEIQSHVSEPFWYIHVSKGAEPPDTGHCEFTWARGRLFDQDAAVVLYEMCAEQPLARVLEVRGQQRRRWPPHPLSTLEMQKRATQYLRMSGDTVMKIAEELYQEGYLSYPRTETDVFDPGQDLRAIVADHVQDPRWGAHAGRIMDGSMWRSPPGGGHDDKAHPPIHPTRWAGPQVGWPAPKARLYEFIVRHFLACCSREALGQETVVNIDIAGESFRTTGLMVLERNWLEVYPWGNWGGNANLPTFQQGQTFMPTELLLKEGATQPPPRLSERDLIAAMERYGIGTDATVAEHIAKQTERRYASKDDASMTFWPTPLGEALISGYRRMGLDNLWTPNLRGDIERSIADVAAGRVTKEAVLQHAINAFKTDFQSAHSRCHLLEAEVALALPRAGQNHVVPPGGPGGPGGGLGGGPGGGGGGGDDDDDGGGGGGGPAVGICNKCQSARLLVESAAPGAAAPAAAQHVLRCSSHPLCNQRITLPRAVSGIQVLPQQCQRCTHGHVQLVRLSFRMTLMPPGLFYEPEYDGCVMCDPQIQQLLQTCGPAARAGPRAAGTSQQQAAGGNQQRGAHQQHTAGPAGPGPGSNSHTPYYSNAGMPAAGGAGGGGYSTYGTTSGDTDAGTGRGRQRATSRGRGRGRAGSTEGAGRAGGRGSRSGSNKRTRQAADSDGQPGRSAAGRGRAAANGAARGGGAGALPTCPQHHLPVISAVAKNGDNAGRAYYKCAQGDNNCLKFAWADQYEGGGGGGGGGGRGGGAGGGGGGRGTGAAAAGGTRFVGSTGENDRNTCFKCGQPGHWASSCPNS